MAPSVAHLKRRVEFLRVSGTKRKWVAPGLILQVRPHKAGDRFPGEAPPIRVGFTVSRKVGNAVTRNRARRRLRALAEEILPIHANPGHDFVVIGRAASVNRPFPALADDLKTALKRLKVYRKAEIEGERSQ